VRTPIWVVVVLALLHADAHAADSTLTLRGNLLTGWRYSIDGAEYKSVGVRGKSLFSIAEGNEYAERSLRSYRGYRTAAIITGVAGGVLMAWPIIDNNFGDRHANMYNGISFVSGTVLEIVTFFLASNSGDHLREGVARINAARLDESHPPGDRPSDKADMWSTERAFAMSAGTGVSVLLVLPAPFIEFGCSFDKFSFKIALRSILFANQLGGEFSYEAYRWKKSAVSLLAEGGMVAVIIPGAEGGFIDPYVGGGIEYARFFSGGRTAGAVFVRGSVQYCQTFVEDFNLPLIVVSVGIRGMRRFGGD
jgi:hypothetical protein